MVERALTRRTLLRLSVVGGALLGAGGAALRWLRFGYDLPVGAHPIALDTKETVIVHAIVDALLPEEPGFVSGRALGIARRIDEEAWAAPEPQSGQLRDALQVLEHAAPLYGYAGRLSSLAREDAARYLSDVIAGGNATLSLAANALRQLVHLTYYSHPRVYDSMGYEGPYVAEPLPPATHLRYEALRRKARG